MNASDLEFLLVETATLSDLWLPTRDAKAISSLAEVLDRAAEKLTATQDGWSTLAGIVGSTDLDAMIALGERIHWKWDLVDSTNLSRRIRSLNSSDKVNFKRIDTALIGLISRGMILGSETAGKMLEACLLLQLEESLVFLLSNVKDIYIDVINLSVLLIQAAKFNDINIITMLTRAAEKAAGYDKKIVDTALHNALFIQMHRTVSQNKNFENVARLIMAGATLYNDFSQEEITLFSQEEITLFSQEEIALKDSRKNKEEDIRAHDFIKIASKGGSSHKRIAAQKAAKEYLDFIQKRQ